MNIEKLINLLNKSHSQFHVVEIVKNILKENGFQEINEYDAFSVQLNQKYFVIRNDSSIIALQSSSDDHEGRLTTLETNVSTLETDVSEIKGDYLTSADRQLIDEKIENDIKVVADDVAAIKEDYLTSQDFLILDCGSYNNNN
jgi:hypothetical protein